MRSALAQLGARATAARVPLDLTGLQAAIDAFGATATRFDALTAREQHQAAERALEAARILNLAAYSVEGYTAVSSELNRALTSGNAGAASVALTARAARSIARAICWPAQPAWRCRYPRRPLDPPGTRPQLRATRDQPHLVSPAGGRHGARRERLRRPRVVRRSQRAATPWRVSLRDPERAAAARRQRCGHQSGRCADRRALDGARRRAIFASRIDLPRAYLAALARSGAPPSTYVSMSAIGYYGTHATATFTETDPPGNDVLATICAGWEREAVRAAALGMRLDRARGPRARAGRRALERLVPVFRLGLGGGSRAASSGIRGFTSTT